MQKRQTKSIEGSTPFGEKRKYTFLLLDALEGGQLFHEHVSSIVPMFNKLTSGEDLNLPEMLGFIPKMFSWGDIMSMSAIMLKGSTVEIDEQVLTMPDSGIGDYTLGDPIELYTHLFYAIAVNYPKYLAPLLASEDKPE